MPVHCTIVCPPLVSTFFHFIALTSRKESGKPPYEKNLCER